MFTGIIETVGEVVKVDRKGGNLDLTVRSSISRELKIDQSVAHNGVCLTVVEVDGDTHRVTAIDETLQKTNFGSLEVGEEINLERCMKIGDRLDGHIVQGHVDQVGECIAVEDRDGSRIFRFRYAPSRENLVVEKGSICINGVSLTAFDAREDMFAVAIIPYTLEHTNFRELKEGDRVNLEFDVIGKYVARMMKMPQ